MPVAVAVVVSQMPKKTQNDSNNWKSDHARMTVNVIRLLHDVATLHNKLKLKLNHLLIF